jgi:transketolase
MENLQRLARDIRRETFEMAIKAGRGHLGGAFSCVDILVALFKGGILNFDPQQPQWEDRDRFLLSKGHASSVLFVLLAKLGYFPLQELEGFLANGSRLGVHLDRRLPGIETVSGSLGHGLGVGAGMALAARLDGKPHRVFVLMGDGESQEGSVWEAGMFAAQHHLDNLVAITDRNRLGSEDFTESTAGLDPLDQRWASFGWDVAAVDGHDIPAIQAALAGVRDRDGGRPLMLIAHTVKGKGMSVLENTPRSHHTLPRGEEIAITRRDLQ